jgi:hypothetical protein
MSTSSYLANYGVSMELARNFILSNVGNPGLIFETARQFGVTNDMLGEITGYTGDVVRQFFRGYGMDDMALEPKPIIDAELARFGGVLALDTSTGILSVAALHDQVVARTGSAAYQAAFDPTQFAGSADGVFTPAELGTAAFGQLPATTAILESLFYGTIINLAHSIDPQEAGQLVQFMSINEAALERDDPVAVAQAIDLLQGVLADPAPQSFLNDALLAQAVVDSAVALVGQRNDDSLIGHMFDAIFEAL